MKRVELAPVISVQCADSLVARYGWSNIMPRFLGVQVFLRGKEFKLVCPAQCVIQWYMRYVGFKPQTVQNAKRSYHCSGPLESYLYTQICPVLANFLILMFLSQIYRTLATHIHKKNLRKRHTDILQLSHQGPRNLDVVQAFHKGSRKVLHFTKHYIKVHKYIVWVQETEREESLDQFTFQICTSRHYDVATHLKWSLGEWPF